MKSSLRGITKGTGTEGMQVGIRPMTSSSQVPSLPEMPTAAKKILMTGRLSNLPTHLRIRRWVIRVKTMPPPYRKMTAQPGQSNRTLTLIPITVRKVNLPTYPVNQPAVHRSRRPLKRKHRPMPTKYPAPSPFLF